MCLISSGLQNPQPHQDGTESVKNSRNRKENRRLSSYLAFQRRPGHLWFFELAVVLVRFDHIASGIVNANHGIM